MASAGALSGSIAPHGDTAAWSGGGGGCWAGWGFLQPFFGLRCAGSHLLACLSHALATSLLPVTMQPAKKRPVAAVGASALKDLVRNLNCSAAPTNEQEARLYPPWPHPFAQLRACCRAV